MSNNMVKHVAKTNTDQRCVVVYMQIPGREDHALICPTDSLPDRLEHAVMSVVQSPEGQADAVLANVLSRRVMPDTGEYLLNLLHSSGKLVPVPIDNVFMMPLPNMPFPLRDIIEQMGGRVPGERQTVVADDAALNRFNPHANTMQTESDDQMVGKAQGLIMEAELLEAEAQTKRNRAYLLAPGLRPVENVELAERFSGERYVEETEEVPAEKPKRTRKKV